MNSTRSLYVYSLGVGCLFEQLLTSSSSSARRLDSQNVIQSQPKLVSIFLEYLLDYEVTDRIFEQTYTRKVDLRVANALSAFGATVQKIGSDIRHLVRHQGFVQSQILIHWTGSTEGDGRGSCSPPSSD